MVLEPFVHEWQTWNNCGPAALSIGLSYFGIEDDQAVIGDALHPHPADKNVSMHELLDYASSLGIESREMINGDLDTLRRLVAAGVPVLTEGLLRIDEDIGHYRVVRGYDLSTDEILASDSFFGAEVWISSDEFNAMWMPFFYAYAPLYLVDQESLVASAVGPTWDRQTMQDRALSAALSAVNAQPSSALLWHSLGDAYFLTDQLDAALDAYERSVELGLPERFFWYRFNYLVLLNALGQHAKLLELTLPLVGEVDSLAEVHVERGAAFLALGQTGDALVAYEKALEYAPRREDIRSIVDSLR